MTPTKLTNSLLVSAVLAVMLTGCSSTITDSSDTRDSDTSAATPAAAVAPAIAPVIDDKTGVIAQGSSRFYPSMYDTLAFDSAAEIALSDCVSKQGVSGDQMKWTQPDSAYLLRSAVGVWRKEDAAKYAFAQPMPAIDLIGNGVLTTALPSSEVQAAQAASADLAERIAATDAVQASAPYKAALESCQNDPEASKWKKRIKDEVSFSGPWGDGFRAASNGAFKDERMQKPRADYVACLERSGLKASVSASTSLDDFFLVDGANPSIIDENQIKMALISADCKTSTKAAATVMGIWAEYETPVYEKYQPELQENLTRLEEWQDDAQAFWAKNAS